MSVPPTPSDAAPAVPQGPTEKLSLVRVSIVVLVVVAVVGVAFTGVRKAVADAQPRAKSWSVPYVDVTLTPTYQFQDPQSNPSRDVALAFVVADPEGSCTPSWGGAYTLDEAGDDLELDRRIAQLRAAGGDVMISFGGLNNQELAVTCDDQAELEDAYRTVIERYDANVVDFDIEGDALADTASIERRVAAIATIQQERAADGDVLDVWLTLPVATSGLTADGVALLRSNLDGGVTLLGVNAMTMNFSDERNPTSDMLSASKKALEATATQIGDVYREMGTTLDEAKRWAKLGATPMIGQNDVDGEVFTLDDAQGLVEFAQSKGVARVSTWSLNRDRACGATFSDVAVHSNTCSGVARSRWPSPRSSTPCPARPPPPATSTPSPCPTRPTSPTTGPQPVPGVAAHRPVPRGLQGRVEGQRLPGQVVHQGSDPSTSVSSQWETPWALIGPVVATDSAPTITTVLRAPCPRGTRPPSTRRAPPSRSTACPTRRGGRPRAMPRRPSSRSGPRALEADVPGARRTGHGVTPRRPAP